MFASRRLLATSLLVCVASEKSCMEWCVNSCCELSGDPTDECSGCTRAGFACRPGTECYALQPPSSPSPSSSPSPLPSTQPPSLPPSPSPASPTLLSPQASVNDECSTPICGTPDLPCTRDAGPDHPLLRYLEHEDAFGDTNRLGYATSPNNFSTIVVQNHGEAALVWLQVVLIPVTVAFS